MAPQHIYESIDNLVVKFENMPTWKYTNLFLNAAKMSQRRHLQHLAFYILLCSWGQKIGIYMYRLTVNCIFIYNMFNICRNGGPNSWEQTTLYMSNSTDAFCPCLKQGPHSQLQTTLWNLPLRQKERLGWWSDYLCLCSYCITCTCSCLIPYSWKKTKVWWHLFMNIIVTFVNDGDGDNDNESRLWRTLRL